jgi:predicted nuclease with RNAse H fold
MDVEGHEFEIIEGGWKTIERFKPDICMIYMELHILMRGFRRAVNLLARLMKIGYRIEFAGLRIIDHYPLSFTKYIVRSRGSAKQQLLQIFSKLYMSEVIYMPIK